MFLTVSTFCLSNLSFPRLHSLQLRKLQEKQKQRELAKRQKDEAEARARAEKEAADAAAREAKRVELEQKRLEREREEGMLGGRVRTPAIVELSMSEGEKMVWRKWDDETAKMQRELKQLITEDKKARKMEAAQKEDIERKKKYVTHRKVKLFIGLIKCVYVLRLFCFFWVHCCPS